MFGHEQNTPQLSLIRTSAIRREALRIAPVRPNVAAGLRAGVATALPLLVASVYPQPELAFTSLAGFSVVLADKGGAYGTRALSMLAVTLCGALATVLGMLGAVHPILSLGLVVLVVVLAGFLRMFGAEATAVGTSIVIALVVALTRPAPTALEALLCGGYFVAGGLWAMSISLLLWPLRVFRPARLAIADALGQLIKVASSLVDASPEPQAQLARREQLGRTRTAIELARARLGSARRGRLGPSRRGELLVALVEACDRVFGALVAIEDSVAFDPRDQPPQLARWIKQLADHTERELSRVARALLAEEPLPEPEAPRPPPVTRSLLPDALRLEDHEPRILVRAIERVDLLVRLARAIDDPTQPAPGSTTQPEALSSEASKWSLMRDHFSLESAIFRHALRTTIATGATVLIVKGLDLDHGYWATLTCIVIMQPHGSQTWAKALQRVVGTVLGAALAFAVATWLADPHLLVASVFVLVAVAVALLPLNYGVFAVFLTPAFVLLAETHAGNSDLAGVRIANTLLGASIALLASRLLFPLSERDQIRPLLADALGKVVSLLSSIAVPEPAIEQVRAARRALGLSLLNAEASYQRLITETGIPPEQSEAVLSLLLYAHRITSGLIAIVFVRGSELHARLIARGEPLRASLLDIRAAIAERGTPRPAPEPEPADEATERVELLFEQLAILRAACLRFRV